MSNDTQTIQTPVIDPKEAQVVKQLAEQTVQLLLQSQFSGKDSMLVYQSISWLGSIIKTIQEAK